MIASLLGGVKRGRFGSRVPEVQRAFYTSGLHDDRSTCVAGKSMELSAMAEVIRKTESKFPGLWLLDRAGLTALDEIIDEQWSRLEAYKKRGVSQCAPTKHPRSTRMAGPGRKRK